MDMASRLQLFLDILHHGSFAKAADHLNLDRSVVSKQFKALEDDLGVRLLTRSTRSIAVTDAGLKIAKRANIVGTALADTRKLAESFHDEPMGLIRIVCQRSFGKLYLQDAIQTFMRTYPKTHVDLVLDDRRSDLIGEKFDIGFRIGPPRDSDLIYRKLATNKLAIVASKGFVEQHGHPQNVQELIEAPGVVYFNSETTFDSFEIGETPNSRTLCKVPIKGRFKANDATSLLKATQAGLGYSVVSLSSFDRNISELGLVPLLTDHALSSHVGGLFAVYPHRNQTPLVLKFIDAVVQSIGTPPIWESYIDGYASLYKQGDT